MEVEFDGRGEIQARGVVCDEEARCRSNIPLLIWHVTQMEYVP
jgi:hypothetical protein